MYGEEIQAGSPEATLDATGGADASFDGDPSGDAGLGAAPAPAETSQAEKWAPPSREAFEEAQKFAELGREFAPYANQIRQLVARGFSPAEAKAEVKAQAEANGDDDLYTNLGKWNDFWKNVGQNPALLRDTIKRTALSTVQPKFEGYDRLAKDFESFKQQFNELRGWAVQGNALFARNPEVEKHLKPAAELVQSGRIGDLATAVEFVKAQERIKALEKAAAQAKAAGVAPAAGASAKPSPRQDASGPRSGVGRGAAPVGASAPSGRKGNELKDFIRSQAKSLRGA